MNSEITVKSFIISIAIITPLLVIAGFTQAARQVSMTWQAVTAACVNTWNVIFGSISHPSSIIMMVIAAVLGVGLIRGIFFIIWQFYKIKRLEKNLHANIIHKHGLSVKYEFLRVVDAQGAFAVTLGIRKPIIYLSTGLVDVLSDQEIASVVAHEQYHLRNKHTLNNALIALVRSLLFFVPAVTELAKSIALKQELEADHEAVRATSRASLAAAILKIMEGNGHSQSFLVSAAPFSIMSDRTRALLGERVSAYANVTKKILAISIFMIAAMVVFLSQSHVEYARAYTIPEEDDLSNLSSNYCHNPNQSFSYLFSIDQHKIFPNRSRLCLDFFTTQMQCQAKNKSEGA